MQNGACGSVSPAGNQTEEREFLWGGKDLRHFPRASLSFGHQVLTQAKGKEEGWPGGIGAPSARWQTALSGVGMFICWRALQRDQDRPDPRAKANAMRFSRVKSWVLSLAHNSLQCYRLGQRDCKAPQQEGPGHSWTWTQMCPGVQQGQWPLVLWQQEQGSDHPSPVLGTAEATPHTLGSHGGPSQQGRRVQGSFSLNLNNSLIL